MSEITIVYMPVFLKQIKKFEPRLRDEAVQKINQFKDRNTHEHLRVHKLKGALKNCYGFSVTYNERVVFMWKDSQTAIFLSVGDHDVYN